MARRVALAALVVAGVIIAMFVIARVVPGDPAATWAGPHASAAQVAAARRLLHEGVPPPVPEVTETLAVKDAEPAQVVSLDAFRRRPTQD